MTELLRCVSKCLAAHTGAQFSVLCIKIQIDCLKVLLTGFILGVYIGTSLYVTNSN